MKQDKIAVLVPIREREKLLERFIESYLKTTEGRSQLIFGIDEDDDTYKRLMNRYPQFIWDVGPKGTSLQQLNRLALKYAPEYEWVSFGEDDCVFIKKGWESRYIIELQKYQLAIVWEWLQEGFPKKLIGLPHTHSKLIEILGFFSPPPLHFLAADDYWTHLANATQIGVEIEHEWIDHLHFITNKSPKDHIAERIASNCGPDLQRLAEYEREHFRDDVRKVIEVLVDMGQR